MNRVALVGCGHAGSLRARSLAGASLKVCCDLDLARAETIAADHRDAQVSDDWRSAVTRNDVDIVVVCTPHNLLAAVTEYAVRNHKHVLVEKPGAINELEADALIAAARETGALVRVGFNHRYHPAIRHAKNSTDAGQIGNPLYVRCRYGHCGFPGFERQWRADRAISGGGAVIDQGVHMIDLARWFLGDFSESYGLVETGAWDMSVEDNGFMLLRTARGQVASIHVSSTAWKPVFEFEVGGDQGTLIAQGLGRKYGVERLSLSKRTHPPTPFLFDKEFPTETSRQDEFDEFLEDIRLARTPAPGLLEAKAALHVVDDTYKRASARSTS